MPSPTVARSAPRWRKRLLRGPVFTALFALSLMGLFDGSGHVARAQDATPAADSAANKALVLRFLDEIWSKGNYDVADEILAPDFTWRFGATEVFLVGPAAVKAHYENLGAGSEGVRLTVDIALAEGNHVAVRWTLEEIYPMEGGTPQPPRLACTGNNIYRVEGGLIAELWQESVSCA